MRTCSPLPAIIAALLTINGCGQPGGNQGATQKAADPDITSAPNIMAGENLFPDQVPPDFPAAGNWINSDRPLTLTALKGRVVWLEFSFLH